MIASFLVQSKTRGDHDGLHFLDGVLPADEHRLRDDRMTNVQLDDFRNFGDCLDIRVVQTMSGIDLEPKFGAFQHPLAYTVEFARLIRFSERVGIAAGVKFDDRRAGFRRSLDLLDVGIDEETHTYALTLQLLDRGADILEVRDDVQPALSRHLRTAF